MKNHFSLRHLEKEKELAKAINKFHGKSYYFATAFFPSHIRDAIYILYAFFRVPDEIVDTAHASDLHTAKKELELWKQRMHEAFRSKHSDDPILYATQYVFRTYSIPVTHADSFIDAMILDTEKKRYATYEELCTYMDGSAVAVGYIVSSVIGYSQGALPFAKALGEAMQLTNIIRDVEEDFDTRDRIYIPEEDLQKYGVTTEIETHTMTDAFRACIFFQINRARELYRIAEQGIPMLDKKGRLPVLLALRLYEGILDEIEAHNGDVFMKRHRVHFLKKIYYTIFAIMESIWIKK